MLVLQRVHKLVRQRGTQQLAGRALYHVEGIGFGIVVTSDLFRIQIEQQLLQIYRIGHQTECCVSSFDPGKLCRRQLFL